MEDSSLSPGELTSPPSAEVFHPTAVALASPDPVAAVSSFPVVSAVPPPSEGINPALTEETIMATPEAAALQDNTDSPQDPPHDTPLLLDLELESSPSRPLKVR